MHHLNDNIHDCYIQITIRSLFCYSVHEMRPNIVKRLSPGCGLQIPPDDTLHSPHAFCNKTDIIHCHSSTPLEVCSSAPQTKNLLENIFQLPQLPSQTVTFLGQLQVLFFQLSHLRVQLRNLLKFSHSESTIVKVQ